MEPVRRRVWDLALGGTASVPSHAAMPTLLAIASTAAFMTPKSQGEQATYLERSTASKHHSGLPSQDEKCGRQYIKVLQALD